uniref:Plasmid stabilization protein n=1 Tax=Caenorhabditis tropicalis TaxID=1561998 RepID=A0A1I7UJK3_9PELO
MTAKRSPRSPLPKAVRVSEEFWGSIGQMGGFEMSTMGAMRRDSDETAKAQRQGGNDDDDDRRISDQEATKGEKEAPEG